MIRFKLSSLLEILIPVQILKNAKKFEAQVDFPDVTQGQ